MKLREYQEKALKRLNPFIANKDKESMRFACMGLLEESGEVIAELRNENKELTILSITHDIDEASKSDEVIILNKGVLYKQGKPQDIFVDDSSLEDIRLDLPFTFRLHKALKEEGLNVQYENSVEEMVKKICQ